MTSELDVASEPRRRHRWLAISLVTGAVVVVGTVFAPRVGRDPTLVQSPLIGRPAPEFVLPYLERDGTLGLSALKGKIVVINFWASWCVPCRKEQPELVATSAAYRAAGVEFVGIVYQDRQADAIAFLDELGRGYDSVLDPGSRTALEYGVFGVPETFFVDLEGTMVAKITGPTDRTLLADVLDQMLAGATPQSRRTGTPQPAPSSGDR